MGTLRDLLTPARLTQVVDVGANPVTNGRAYTPPYAPMLAQGLCQVTGFEPQPHALASLLEKCGPHEHYLPYAVGDGGSHTLNVTRSQGMTSLLTPDWTNLAVLGRLHAAAEIVERIPLETRRLDDISEIEHLDFLKIDIQGGELAVFENGRNKLAECVAIQVEVAFVTFYENQPTQGDIDAELRGQGFVPHCLAELKKWPIAPSLLRPMNQLLEADIVYVRNFFRPDELTDEQLKHLTLIAHHCYGSFDLAVRCVQLLEERHAVEAGTTRRYATGPLDAGQPKTVGENAQALPDARSVFLLAQHNFDADDFAQAREMYLRRIALGGDDQEVYCSIYGLAESMARLGEPWKDVQTVYLRAWQLRPTRAEPLYAIACRCRQDRNYEDGYAAATRAAAIPLPDGDLLVDADVYAWRALDEQAACAHYVRPVPEVFGLWQQLLARPGVPDDERQRIAADRDMCARAVSPDRVGQVPAAPTANNTADDPAPTRFAIASPEPAGYHSFDDFAETLHYALLALGHDSVLTKSLDLSDLDGRCPIVLSPNYLARFGVPPPRNAILYNFEQIYADSPWMTPALLDLFMRHPVWDYSQANIERLAAWGVPRLTHVPVGYVPELTRITPAPEDIDVLFYGRMDDRRRLTLEQLTARGLSVKVLDRVYGCDRDAWIARSKLVVNIHAGRYPNPVFEIARVSYLLANKRAVVSEAGVNPDDRRGLESGIAFAEYDELAGRCVELVGDTAARHELAERGYRAFSARSETLILRRALAATLSRD